MTVGKQVQYTLMKDLGAPILSGIDEVRRRFRGRRPPPKNFGPPLAAGKPLRRIMTRHYLLARYAKGHLPVAWVTSGAPVELLRLFGCYTVYPENHGALCGARGQGAALCSQAEERGYSQDLCSYARIDLGHLFSDRTPVGRLPRPDLLFCCTNICQTVLAWYRVLADYLDIPLFLFDTPFVFEGQSEADFRYMAAQLEAMVPALERVTGRSFDRRALSRVLELSKRTSALWGDILETMQHRPAPMSIFDAFAHMAPVVSLRGLPIAEHFYRSLLDELRGRMKAGIGALREERRRLLWDNIAMWYRVAELARLFAARGCNFVVATYTNAWAETSGLLEAGEPFLALAKAYSPVILNNRFAHRLGLMQRLITDYQVDGLVIHSARSCKPYSIGQYELRHLLVGTAGIPAVIIEADIADERVYAEEQTRTRLEAFFEQLGV